jgi:thioredoxin 1
VVVDFWATWCAPCRMLEPVLEALAEELDGRLSFAKVNADEHPELLDRYDISGIPTLIAFQGGNEIGRIVGYLPKELLARKLEALITSEAEAIPEGSER